MMLLAYIHPACGKPAFLMRRRPRDNGTGGLDLRDAQHLDGSAYLPGPRAGICDSCGGEFFEPLIRDTRRHLAETEIAVA